MSNNSNSSNGGIGVLGLLGVAFVVLKLTGYINWSWWWITAPFWGGFAFVFAVLIMIGLAWLIKYTVKSRKKKSKYS